MFREYVFSVWLSILISVSVSLSAGTVTVDINSGNPAHPFPQFTDYGPGRATLASNMPPGVTHAEMEQRGRDAWQIMANRFVYSGPSVAGVAYIQGNVGCPYDCSEGTGYALLAAATMGDKTTFDGLFFRFHDNRLVKLPRYLDCVIPNAAYIYGNTPVDNTDSAADGDFDIALALLTAWRQWGDLQGSNDACGNPISYKDIALYVMRALVETGEGTNLGDCPKVSGDIGFDGYIKGGNTWQEMSNGATGQCPDGPEFTGPTPQHIDYAAPAYFKCFAQTLLAQDGPGWNVDQYLRAEASSDWLMGQMQTQNLIPYAGWVNLSGASPVFSTFNQGEDFRAGMRTALNYVWNGNPGTTWNPITRQVAAGGNTFELDLANDYAAFLTNPQSRGQACASYGSSPITYNGVPSLVLNYAPSGAPLTTFHLNWIMGSGAPAAVASQDFNLMAEMWREAVIEWDGTAGYLSSTPVYFHGFFRWLAMLTLTGNHGSPCDIQAGANLKVYKSVDKTFAFVNDTINYVIDWRNYGSLSATGVTLVDVLPADLEYISSNPAAASVAGQTLTWNLGTVPGLQNQNVAATRGWLTLTAKVRAGASGRLCNTATINAVNSLPWTSNEYPNNITDVMERNCVDIVSAALQLTKTANPATINPGDNITYTLEFCNSSSAGWLNGGRPGVTLAFANNGNGASSDTQWLKARLYHGADEPYINYQNYRMSYFINDAAHNQFGGPPANSWNISQTIFEGGTAIVTQENIVPGSDATGAWNQRVIIRFADQQVTTAPHLYNYFGMAARIHEGGSQPLRNVWRLFTADFSPIDWTDDWSADALAADADGGGYYPITNDWTDPNNLNVPITRLHKHACEIAAHTVNNILVEEWDGYTWRRAFGDGPAPGREIINASLRDVLAAEVTFGGFTQTALIGNTVYNAATRTIEWDMAKMLVNQCGTIRYWVSADPASTWGGCPLSAVINNTAILQGDSESPVSDSAQVALTCAVLPPPPLAPTSMTKTADSVNYLVGQAITYTLGFTQTQGSLASPANASLSDWNIQSGAALTSGGGGIQNVSNQSQVSTYGFSHGTDGELRGTLNLQSFSVFGIALRHTGGAMGNGVYVTFKHNPPSSEISFWNGTVLVNTATVSFGSLLDFRIRLSGPVIDVWVNTLTGPPLASQSGMTVQAGYAGLINGTPAAADTWGLHTMSNWWSHLDSAFNLQITDPLPAEVTFAAADNGGVNTAGTITWPMQTGPVLTGASLLYHWWGSVASGCGGSVINTAYANMLGQVVNSIGAQATITVICSGTFTATPALSVSPSFTPTPSVSPSPTPTASLSPTQTLTATSSVTPTNSLTLTYSYSPTALGTFTATTTYTHSATLSPSFSSSPSATISPTQTSTATVTSSASATATATQTLSASASATKTPTATQTSSATATATKTVTASATATATITESFSATASSSATSTQSATSTLSATITVSPTVSATHTISPTFTLTPLRFFEQRDLVIERGLFPNPFSDRLKVFFTLRLDAQVRFTVYNVAGEEVYFQMQSGLAGKNVIEWAGVNRSGSWVASGIYLIHLQATGVDSSTGGFWGQAAVAR